MIASAFTDLGFDVVSGPLFQTPDEAAKMAIDRQGAGGRRLLRSPLGTAPYCHGSSAR